jgi:hypothetical protein
MTRLMKFCVQQLVVACMLSGAATAQTAQSNDELELAFNGHCRECHAFDKGDNRLGPTLYGVVGRKAGTVPNFALFGMFTSHFTGNFVVIGKEIVDHSLCLIAELIAPLEPLSRALRLTIPLAFFAGIVDVVGFVSYLDHALVARLPTA